MPPIPVTDNIDEQEPDAATALISLASVGTDNLNDEMPPIPVIDNIDEQEPEFHRADVLDPDLIREEEMNMEPDRHILLRTLCK